MINRNGYIGAVPTQSKSVGNEGILSINSHSILKRRDELKSVSLPPLPSGMSWRWYHDANQNPSYAGTGTTWTDISGAARPGYLANVNWTSGDPSYFNLSDSFYYTLDYNSLRSDLSVFWVMQTTDTQSLMVTSSSGNDYLGAYRSGNKYYHNSVGGNKTPYINNSSVSNLYDSIRGSTSRLVTITDCDFNFTNSQYRFNTYDGYKFGNGKLYAAGAIHGNLSSSQVTDLYNHFNDMGYIGI